ncbi:P-loop containing nucleoside triphosphate hydrolase protein [Pseudovirgaria hyperparasitica]|uniref:P-loop containing nucleoside triphosphate hydrolase protein n=1 Tax=Pseudovirgaria hyperparasitica TaxID=470096 RepID=A0A6A6VVR4_9PEZI|nr:P-loop containing nucleoside triphosphate hydrolase protein [Pseudovirgaria hyperparasitica]KAF2753331.1 P-loop containing nucleoside triphosphate hydrolase protein [Pseudovirgaria hyperparasitica]
MGSISPETPEVEILLLGDTEVGMSSFLSRLSMGRSRYQDEGDAPPPYSLPKLRDLDQPFQFDISMYNRPYRFRFYDTSCPESYTLLKPDFIIMCYDIARRKTLESVQDRWKRVVESHFNYDEALPVMLLGLKRDLRQEWTETNKESVIPQEAVRIAQEMRLDRYAECSAITGELCREVLEDIAKTAAMTTTQKGGKTEGGCAVM